jgi:predicted ATP-grasp superfamily ATP-dependent carboligase
MRRSSGPGKGGCGAVSNRHVVIVGASVRAAAQSARRAGYVVYAVDLFGDTDLQAIAHSMRVRKCEYPRQLPRLVTSLPTAPWMYTGGLENDPDIVDAISATRSLLGNAGQAIRAVRDPANLALEFAKAGFTFPEVRRPSAGVQRTGLECEAGIRRPKACQSPHQAPGLPPIREDHDGRWLVKPFASCGGARIRVDDGTVPVRDAQAHYLQRWVVGPSYSAVYLGSAEGSAALVGVTRQYLAKDLPAAVRPPVGPFSYVGSVGPVTLTVEQTAVWSALGACVAERFRMRGLFGIDVICSAGALANPVPVEVNPRWTASVEVLERALGFNAFAAHVAACRGKQFIRRAELARSSGVVGKAILFARSRCVAGQAFHNRIGDWNRSCGPRPTVVDIPPPGTLIEAGRPVVSLLLSGPNDRQVTRMLGLSSSRGMLRELARELT